MHKRQSLTEKQRYAIRLLTQFPINKTYQQMAEEIGVDVATFRAWRNRNPMFIAALDERIRELG